MSFWRQSSIRDRLTVHLVSAICGLLLLFGAGLGWVVISELQNAFDRELDAKAHAIVALTSVEGPYLEVDTASGQLQAFDLDRTRYQLFLDPSQVTVKKSDSLKGSDLPVDWAVREGKVFRDFDSEGRRCRSLQMPVNPRRDLDDDDEEEEHAEDPDLFRLPADTDSAAARLILVVAREREELDGLIASLLAAMGLLGLMLGAATVWVVRSAVGWGLRDLEVVDRQLGMIGPGDLAQRLRLESPPDELVGVVSALNSVLDRIESGFARERRFTSDVAHELRTPVAELRTACEVGARWPDDSESVRQWFEDVLETTMHMERVVTTLLALSRSEADLEETANERVGIAELVRQCWERVAEEGSRKGARLDLEVEEAWTIRTDLTKFEMILQNLLDNAATYCAPGSPVACRIEPGGERAVLSISNRAENLAEEDVSHFFERFWRKEAARTDRRHMGLGLSIVTALCKALAMRVRARLDDQGTLVIEVILPVSRLERVDIDNAGATSADLAARTT